MNLLYHPTAIQEGFRTTVHVGNVRQTAVIHSIQPLQQIRYLSKSQKMARNRQIFYFPNNIYSKGPFLYYVSSLLDFFGPTHPFVKAKLF